MSSMLTGRERVQRCFDRRPHDRVPRFESFWTDTIQRWQGEGLVGGESEVRDQLLKADMAGIGWFWPQCFPDGHKMISEDAETKVVREGNGRLARYWKHRQGTPEHLGFDCETRERWESVYKPALLKSALQFDVAALRKQYATAVEKKLWTFLPSVEAFEETRSMMGDEVTMMAMADDPEWIVDVSRTFTDVVLANLQAVIDAGIRVDGIWIYGDMAFKTATMCSPSMYRELIWPDHKRMADWTHERGMKFIYHTDGDVNGVMELYVQAGFDSLQPLEAKANMDIRNLCPKYGDRLTFFGNCDVMEYARGDLGRIEAEISAKIAAGKATGSYIYHSDHSVPPQVSWRTYQAIVGMIDRHGRY
jgi:uroporphyrinogen decarboxylase